MALLIHLGWPACSQEVQAVSQVSSDLTPVEIAKLKWAAGHPHVKIDDFDHIGDSLRDRGYLQIIDAGYVDWFGYWVEITDKGREAIKNVDT